MAKVKGAKFRNTFCHAGAIRFEAGKTYAKTAETDRCDELGFCDAVTIDESELSLPNPTAAEREDAARNAVAESLKAAMAQKIAAAEQVVSDAQQKADTAVQAADAAKKAADAETDADKKAGLEQIATQAETDSVNAQRELSIAQEVLGAIKGE